MDMPGHDAYLEIVRGNHTRTVWTDEPRAPSPHFVLGAYHVAHWYAFGDADHQVEIGFDRLVDRRGGEGRRNVDHRHGGAGLLLRFAHRRKNGNTFVRFSGLSRIYAGDVA